MHINKYIYIYIYIYAIMSYDPSFYGIFGKCMTLAHGLWKFITN